MSEHIEKLLQLAPALLEGIKPSVSHVMVRCPFHGGGREKTPSCSISAYKPCFFCHACGTSGHIAQLLRHFGLGQAAVDIVAPRKADGGSYKKPETLSQKILKGVDPFRASYYLDEGVLDVYRLAPRALLDAGFSHKTLRHFEVGFDTKNMRITYPLRTVFGELVGISGRTIYDIEPRYKIYDRELTERTDYFVPKTYSMEEVKSAVLWHGHLVRPMFFMQHNDKERIFITEGFKAAMWTWQAGITDVVALVGAHLTHAHAELIARATRKVTLFLDNNEAGWRGTHLAADRLLRKGCEVCVAKYPDERQQPDDLSNEEIFGAVEAHQPFRIWKNQHPRVETLKDLMQRRKKKAS